MPEKEGAGSGGESTEGRRREEGQSHIQHETHASLTGAITMMTQTSLPNFPWNMKLTSKLRTAQGLHQPALTASPTREVEEVSH